MGSKRIGLARVEKLIENLKRELSLTGTTLKGPTTSKNVIALTNVATTNRALLASESGSLITLDPSTNTATSINIVLPPPEAGLEYEWCVLADQAHNDADITWVTSGDTVDFEGCFVCGDGTKGIQETVTSTSSITSDATNVKTIMGHSGRFVCDGTDWQTVIMVSNDDKDSVVAAASAGAGKIYLLSASA
tara:strand:- start:1782 stop:2354 length:573 start_codon:yes stop_codon:yes gene_type:complete